MSPLRKILEEIHLLQCSVLPGETLAFTEEPDVWQALLDAYATDPDSSTDLAAPERPARFQVRADDRDVWFDVALPPHYSREEASLPRVLVKGDNLRRDEQERWQAAVKEAVEDVRGSEYPLYELISTHLLPRLHAAASTVAADPPMSPAPPPGSPGLSPGRPPARYHALLTSHHLKSPQKRRALAHWAHELALVGFAKVGYPGGIYCEGAREDVEDFVGRVRGMQWLALRLRFVEPVPEGGDGNEQRRQWAEFEKVGEVVEEMRRLGRESFVVEMGIGSAGANSTPATT
ncbi:hypothetical protein BD413DRAFT_465887 [Trametes elegans]|nr:hypothetical protein BD413DRAFT_465887 [Trametes elegans]